ncbi:unnamed protein product [Moneuplotes crassus]|uniref:non-specific serine/threonine protein kinase n=1 Tax=Euplotes crassus TaxID=5936 RepID=A0AAD1UD98_EUPCR|nr:unnamed protein product [Moneuplotes crassus]
MPNCGKYKIKKKLGGGAFGQVFLSKNEETSKHVAIKIIKPEVLEKGTIDMIAKEVNILMELDHPNITRLLEAGFMDLSSRGKSNEVYCIALELARGGELFDFISISGAFDEDICRYYFLQLLDGIEHLHNKGISHRDLKTENILLDKHYKLKIADFGFSTTKSTNSTRVGTSGYMPPEFYYKKTYSAQAADIYGIGLILFIMRSQCRPYLNAKVDDAQYKYIHRNTPDAFWKYYTKRKGKDYFSEEFKSLLNSLLCFNPCHRLSISEIREHPWTMGPVATSEEVKEEFSRRKMELDEEMKKQKAKDPKATTFDMSLIEGRSVHRGVRDEDDEENLEVYMREEQEYEDEMENYHSFFSTSNLEDLWGVLCEYVITESGGKATFSSNEYSVSTEIVDTDEEEKERLSTDEPSLNAGEYMVHILKVPDQEKHYVEGILLEGDKFKFTENFNQLKQYFGGHINATLAD